MKLACAVQCGRGLLGIACGVSELRHGNLMHNWDNGNGDVNVHNVTTIAVVTRIQRRCNATTDWICQIDFTPQCPPSSRRDLPCEASRAVRAHSHWNKRLQKREWRQKILWSVPGVEPGTTCTRSRYHTTRPHGQQSKILFCQYINAVIAWRHFVSPSYLFLSFLSLALVVFVFCPLSTRRQLAASAFIGIVHRCITISNENLFAVRR